jgi:hypothetical protein
LEQAGGQVVRHEPVRPLALSAFLFVSPEHLQLLPGALFPGEPVATRSNSSEICRPANSQAAATPNIATMIEKIKIRLMTLRSIRKESSSPGPGVNSRSGRERKGNLGYGCDNQGREFHLFRLARDPGTIRGERSPFDSTSNIAES